MRWVNENREEDRMIGERGSLETYVRDSGLAGVDNSRAMLTLLTWQA
jgi:hypothetical protein